MVGRCIFGGLLFLLGAVTCIGWATGWSLHEMTTPSMGTVAPVGSLVVSHPEPYSVVSVGQVIAFHPPGRPTVTFIHRVVGIVHTSGVRLLRTRGDINGGPDPWLLGPSNLIGVTAAVVPDAGFLIEAIPLLMLGAFLILLATSGLRRQTRASARIGAGSLWVAALLLYFRPLERVVLLRQFVSGGRGYASLVPTGILPVSVQVTGGTHTDLVPGQVGSLRLSHVRSNGAFQVASSLHLSGWWWLLLVAWAVPLLVAISTGREDVDGEHAVESGADEARDIGGPVDVRQELGARRPVYVMPGAS